MAQSTDELREALQALFVAETLSPSDELWIVSPWITDFDLIDNRAGQFAAVEPEWGNRMVLFSEVLALLLGAETRLHVVTRPDPLNTPFLDLIDAVHMQSDVSSYDCVRVERLHEKGVVSDALLLTGSMNLTRSGVVFNDELITISTDLHEIAESRVAFRSEYGSHG